MSGCDVEILEFSEVLEQSSGGRSLGDEITDAVVRSGLVAGSLLQRDVRAEAISQTPSVERWFAQPGVDGFFLGLSDEDAVGFTEVFLGAPVLKTARSLSPIERRVLGAHLSLFIAPISSALECPISPEVALVEMLEPPPEQGLQRLVVSFTMDGTALACTLATRDAHASTATGDLAMVRSGPSIEDIPVDVAVALHHIRVGWGKLASLQVGDIIACAVSELEPISAWVGEHAVFSGHVVATDEDVEYHLLANNLERYA